VIARWHLNKSEGNDTALRMMDSRAFRTATRSVLLVVADSENQGRGIVALDKVNATPLGAFPHCAKNCARHRTRWRRSTPSPSRGPREVRPPAPRDRARPRLRRDGGPGMSNRRRPRRVPPPAPMRLARATYRCLDGTLAAS
jgi:hypothetical protein